MNPLSDDVLGQLLTAYRPDIAATQRDRLASLAEGAIGRALTLAEGDGIPAAELVERVLEALPAPKPSLAHEVADALGRGEDAFSTFMDLLRAAIATAVRDVARGRSDPDQARLIGSRPLDAWVEIWQGLGTVQAETEDLYLDKRQAIAASVAMLGSAV
jgi:DNA polymerase-3 subunit delta'